MHEVHVQITTTPCHLKASSSAVPIFPFEGHLRNWPELVPSVRKLCQTFLHQVIDILVLEMHLLPHGIDHQNLSSSQPLHCSEINKSYAPTKS